MYIAGAVSYLAYLQITITVLVYILQCFTYTVTQAV